MGSSARNGPRVSSARRTRRTLPVHPADPAGNDQLAAPMTEPEPPAETTIATADTAARSAAVPRGLEIAAAWAWRVILVVILLGGIAWLVRYLSEVFIPIAVAILLTALMVPVADALKKWGWPRAAATAITVIGAVALIVGALILIGGQIAGQGAELSNNVVNGFNKLSDWLNNGPLTEWLRNGPLHI